MGCGVFGQKNKKGEKVKRNVLIGSLLLVLVLTVGTTSTGIILRQEWPLLPLTITVPVVEALPPAHCPIFMAMIEINKKGRTISALPFFS